MVVINADTLGHEAYMPGTQCLTDMVAYFGDAILGSDGSVDRTKLGPIVFSDPAHMTKLNELVWPRIEDIIRKKIVDLSETHAKVEPEEGKPKLPLMIVVEAAILVEAKWDILFDEIWVVTVPTQVALTRLMERNKLTSEAAQQRIDSQISSAERAKHGHVEIVNDADMAACTAKVDTEFAKLGGRYNRGGSALDEVEVPLPKGVAPSGLVATTVKRGTMRGFNLWHKATSIVVIHEPTKKIYVQKRAAVKDYCPNMLDPTPGGVLDVGESPVDCAVREIHEEMGVFVSVGGKGGKPKLFDHGSVQFEDSRSRCILYLFSCTVNLDVSYLKLQESEVASVTLMSAEEVLGLPEGEVTGDGLLCLRRFMEVTKDAPKLVGSL